MITDQPSNDPACEECGTAIKGRVDKRFCDDACRASFNNRRRQLVSADDPDFVREIPKIILSNYRILKRLNPGKTVTVQRKEMERLGFNFRFNTSFYKTAEGDIYSFCFDQGYLPIKGERALLVVQPNQALV